ncbi:hypothetical protein GWI33_010586 [Rhynchophorus ferrugineus]|uniref:Uncharacterized protein n=1 Tax=Rhynchophorus ferrugineus TaxID=354439 RepID=A0A834IX50_RHYFE|nr:hypothetical protein GWI33_010586 [Rhynchophorus ferrugineus]
MEKPTGNFLPIEREKTNPSPQTDDDEGANFKKRHFLQPVCPLTCSSMYRFDDDVNKTHEGIGMNMDTAHRPLSKPLGD